ncbi:hypothetical protein bgla_1p1830 (plasmid) [Burkholderia gladioli BSR3]|uniref:Uncharacterized protein n=1 Tax=Burkholderia gladioli (strain BSR3) TaxID=999541 RepID=F2LRS9_BURGS|nr:hypothetical protein bgla_1p1830 [Burkholderia gladioli BSR3]
MFQLTCLGEQYGPLDLDVLCNVLGALRDVEVKVLDLRDGGKAHHLTIGPTGFVHETYGARLVVNDVRLLLEKPGRPVYASENRHGTCEDRTQASRRRAVRG